MIERIEPLGPLVNECSLPGESKGDGVFPSHGNGVPLSRNRWLLTYATRGYRFGDDDWSVVYQIRDGSPVGRVIKEGYLSRAHGEWDPFGDGTRYFRQHGHPVTFGVPKGALINGKRVAHENVFAVKWRVLGIAIHEPGGWKGWDKSWPRRDPRTQAVEWMQFRLNDREDDIEILQPARQLRQKGAEQGDVIGFTRAGEPLTQMNQTFVQAVPFNDDCSEWADVNHFPGGRIAPMKYRFNPRAKLYEWVETAPLIASRNPRVSLYEASLIRFRDEFIIMARKTILPLEKKPLQSETTAGRQDLDLDEIGAAWARSDDPFAKAPEFVYPTSPNCYNVPLTAFLCADGVIRMFGGDASLSPPPRGRRNPLRCWDIDPATFAAANQRVVFDAFDYGLPIKRSADKPEWTPALDFGKLVAHMGGRGQYVLHRCHLNRNENAWAGVYHERIVYAEDCAPTWTFGAEGVAE